MTDREEALIGFYKKQGDNNIHSVKFSKSDLFSALTDGESDKDEIEESIALCSLVEQYSTEFGVGFGEKIK